MIDRALAEGELTEEEISPGRLPLEIACMVAGCFLVYGALFATGFWIYGETVNALIGTALAIGAAYFLYRTWPSVSGQE